MTEIRGGQSVGLSSLHTHPPSSTNGTSSTVRTRTVVPKRETGSGLIKDMHRRNCRINGINTKSGKGKPLEYTNPINPQHTYTLLAPP